MNRSDLGGAHVAPRVLPDKRGRGVGTALLTRLAELAVERGFERAGSHVAGADERSIAFARRFGFEETRRDVKQVLDLDDALRHASRLRRRRVRVDRVAARAPA